MASSRSSPVARDRHSSDMVVLAERLLQAEQKNAVLEDTLEDTLKDTLAAMMKDLSSLGMRERMKRVQALQQGLASGGTLTKNKVGTGKRLTASERTKLKKEREKEARRRKREQRGR